MRGFTRFAKFGLLAALIGCQDEVDPAAEPPIKGGPDDPGPDPAPPQPSPPGPVPTTSADDESSGTGTTTVPESSTSSDTSGSAGASTGTPAGCGDGIVGPGEQCDESYQFNSNSAACLENCQLAQCGDGHVQAGVEQCDLGADNNDNTYAGCQETCVWGEKCGDGALQPDHEECDASAPAIEGLAPCDPDVCKFKARVAFVTEAQFSGALGGLALADAACVAAALAAELDNASSFHAWLSDGVATPLSRLKKAAVDPGYPYARRDGQLLALDLQDLIKHGPKLPLDVTETGAVLPAEHFAWTNVGADAAPFSAVNHCKEWTSAAFGVNARVGQVSPASAAELPAWKATRRWTSVMLRTCTMPAHLYCFED